MLDQRSTFSGMRATSVRASAPDSIVDDSGALAATDAHASVAVAAYVICTFFSTTSMRIRSLQGEDTSWKTVSIEPSLTVRQAADRMAATMGEPVPCEFSVAPSSGAEHECYRLRRTDDGDVRVLTGPMVAAGRIVLAEIDRSIRHTLQQIEDDKDRALASLDLADDEVRRKLIASAGRRVPYPTDMTIAQRFAHQARGNPDRQAIVQGERSLTYGELSELVNGFAHELVAAGAQKGEVVPVMLDNSLELPVALLALMQIGAPFVIVDHLWPPARLAKALRRLQPKHLVRGAAVEVRTDPDVQHIVAALDRIRPVHDGVDCDPGRPRVLASDLIYGLFTSGSTGEPKCALNYHGGILNRFEYMNRRFGGEQASTILQTSKQVYDGFIWQLFWPLTRGARVIMPKHTHAPDPLLFVELIEQHKVTMTDIVPSVFKLVLRLLQRQPEAAARLATLRRILIGGEKINPSDVAAFKRMCPQVAFTNTYGPTEASIGMIMHEVGAEEVDFIPLGRPIDNTYALVVDAYMRAVPRGVIGELLIGGDCLGAGYFGDEQATARAMIANPYSMIPGRTLYRTGDLAYLLPAGTLQFAGRIDDQVSIGGARVEIMEVETVLASLSEVAEVSVIAHESRAGSTQLIAFIVPAGTHESEERLQARILAAARETLPRNYLPQRLCFVPRIPLMENGKTDRQRLLALLAETQDTERAGVAELADGVERELAALWRDVLKLEAVGANDNFFVRGGDSMQALILTVEVQHRFGVRLSLESIFQHPLLREMAALVRGEAVDVRRGDAAALTRELFLESELPPVRRIAVPRAHRSARRVLLTGVTGFVGAHIAASALAEKGTELVCPVRGESEYACIARVASSLAAHSSWQNQFIDRIRVIPSRLDQPCFGLPHERFQSLMGSVDAVILNAASVHALHSYAKLKPVNVDSVREVLLHCLQDSAVPVHFISSLSIFTEQQQERLSEDTIPDAPPLRDGYAQSKWVADRLCLAASRAGAAVSVYRLGEMMSPLNTGFGNETALSTHLLSTILKLGVYPEKKVYLDYTPVDVAARIIVRAVLSGMVNKVYHICNNRPLGFDELSAMLARALGRHPSPRAIPDEKFLELLRRACRTNPMDKDLRYVAELLPERVPEQGILGALFTQNSRRCETLNVNALMAHADSVWPDLNVESLVPTSHFFARRMLPARIVHSSEDARARPSMELA